MLQCVDVESLVVFAKRCSPDIAETTVLKSLHIWNRALDNVHFCQSASSQLLPARIDVQKTSKRICIARDFVRLPCPYLEVQYDLLCSLYGDTRIIFHCGIFSWKSMAGGAEKREPVVFPEPKQSDFCKAPIVTHANVFFGK